MINCKVISTYFGPRRFYPCDKNDTKKLLEEVFENELKIDPGVDLDVILVNHDFGDEDVNSFLQNFNDKKIYRGTFKVINRPWDDGIGGSFKSFNCAFETFRNNYENWFFTEDDILTISNNYYKKCLEQIEKSDKIAFIGCNRSVHEENIPKHCHSGCGLTKKKYLNELFEKNGRLPFSKQKMPIEIQNNIKAGDRDSFLKNENLKDWYRGFEINGEVAFTNEYVKMGYEIAELISEEPVVKIYQKNEPFYL